jgi:hypothetical protein
MLQPAPLQGTVRGLVARPPETVGVGDGQAAASVAALDLRVVARFSDQHAQARGATTSESRAKLARLSDLRDESGVLVVAETLRDQEVRD